MNPTKAGLVLLAELSESPLACLTAGAYLISDGWN